MRTSFKLPIGLTISPSAAGIVSIRFLASSKSITLLPSLFCASFLSMMIAASASPVSRTPAALILLASASAVPPSWSPRRDRSRRAFQLRPADVLGGRDLVEHIHHALIVGERRLDRGARLIVWREPVAEKPCRVGGRIFFRRP
jgi:hypothetical protein